MPFQLTIPCDPGGISDGYHTFDELYEHRHVLFLSLVRLVPSAAWMARKHEDGSELEGWFVAGLLTAHGMVTYHLPERLWQIALCTGIKVMDRAPKWDGHTADDVISRLTKGILEGSPFIRKTTDTDSVKPVVDQSGHP
jgi:hypothetical protein